jgi:hypothetical protein
MTEGTFQLLSLAYHVARACGSDGDYLIKVVTNGLVPVDTSEGNDHAWS